jgi:hypothetical protein
MRSDADATRVLNCFTLDSLSVRAFRSTDDACGSWNGYLVRRIVERHSWPLSTKPARLRLCGN